MKNYEDNKDLNPNEINATADNSNLQNESNDIIRQDIEAKYREHMVTAYNSAEAELLAMADRGELKKEDLAVNMDLLCSAFHCFDGLEKETGKLVGKYDELSPTVQDIVLPAAVDSFEIAKTMSTECTRIANDTAKVVRINNIQELADNTSIPTAYLMSIALNNRTADDVMKLYNQGNPVGVASEEGGSTAITEYDTVTDESNTQGDENVGESTLVGVVPPEEGEGV